MSSFVEPFVPTPIRMVMAQLGRLAVLVLLSVGHLKS
jgi:hypothetical protein